MKPEFVPARYIPAHFIVAEPVLQTFIKHLNSNKVFVQPPKHYLTDGDGENFALEIQDGIPPQDGNQLVSTFQTKPIK